MNNEKINIKHQNEVGALWEKEGNKNIRFFGRLDVEEVEKLVVKAKKNKSAKINIIGYVVHKRENKNAPSFCLVESKFNDEKNIGKTNE